MTNTASTESYDFADYLSVLRRRWKTIAGWTLAGLLVAAAYLAVGPKTYTATAKVYVTSNAANSQTLFGSKTTTVVNMDNEAQVVQSTSVSKQAKKILGSSLTPSALLRPVSVAVPANTQVMLISCSESSPAAAARCAEAFANAYLVVRQRAASQKVQGEIGADQLREKALENELQTIEGSLGGLKPGDTGYGALHAKLANVSSRLNPLRAAIASLGASNYYSAGSIITDAIRPSSPSSPRKLLYGPSGLMAGLLIGLGLAFLAERRDDRLHAPADIERYLGVPVLASLGRRPAEFPHALVARHSDYGRTFSELARTGAAELGDGQHAILVTGSPDAGLVGANFAAVLARTRGDVVLVLPDPLATKVPLLARTTSGRGPGLGDVLAGAATVTEAMRPFPGVRRLSVIVGGEYADLVEDLPSDRAARLMSELQAQAAFVVFAASAADEAAMLGLAEFADAAILVTENGRTRRAEVATWLRGLHQMRARVLGVVALPPGGRREGKRSWDDAPVQRAEPGDVPPGMQAAGRSRLPREAGKRAAASATTAAAGPAPGQRKATSKPPWEPVATSSQRRPYTDEPSARPARPQPTAQAPPPPPARPATQTWPMPRVLLPDTAKETPSDPTTGRAAGRSADEK
jgi:capsular polysaccharide biosynthesis protein